MFKRIKQFFTEAKLILQGASILNEVGVDLWDLQKMREEILPIIAEYPTDEHGKPTIRFYKMREELDLRGYPSREPNEKERSGHPQNNKMPYEVLVYYIIKMVYTNAIKRKQQADGNPDTDKIIESIFRLDLFGDLIEQTERKNKK